MGVPLPGSVPLPGAAAASQPAAATQHASALPAAATEVLPPVPGTPSSPTASGAGSTAAKKNRLPLILAIVVAALVVVGGIVAFLTYRSEMWGGKSLPDPASLASEVKDADGKKASVVKAKDVTAALKAKGLATRTEKVFSGADSGTFVGYGDGVQQGDRVGAGTTVVVRESAGPGVPKGTVGKKATSVVSTFANMGVPVHYKQITVTDTKKTPEGTIMATYPNQGQAVAKDEMDDGIYVGVATKGDGLGADIVGKDVDDVESDLESQGYDVTVEKRFSTKKNIGKVTGSDPAPGSSLDSGDDVTLYEGIGADDVQEAFSYDSPETGTHMMLGSSSIAAGTWCRNDGDCITLDGESADLGPGSLPYEKGRDGTDYGEYGMLTACANISDPYCGNDAFLLKQNVGAFEEMPYESLTNYWCDGTKQRDGSSSSCSGKAEYHMQDYFLIVPAGSKLDKLESDGYFDKSALETAKKEKQVDTDRPFLLYRDPKLYDKTTAARSGSSTPNPFVPFNMNANTKNDMVGFKPAPSDANAYYLVDSTGDYDWSSLADAKIDTGSDGTKSGKKTDGSDMKSKKSAKSSKDMSLSEIRSTLGDGDFTPIAGKYCMKDNSLCLTIDKKGKAKESGTQGFSLSPDDPKSTTLHAVTYDTDTDGWWNVPEDVGIELMGPDSDYRCGSEKGGQACYGSGSSYAEYQIQRPADMVYVPAGVSSDKLEGLAKSSYNDSQVAGQAKPDSSKPFIKLLAYRMNIPPTDENVLYLVE
ncbi:PASTA domain-containing protein [Bifidobacterium parmae]|nr:PASTA domain-containing protein [Bifidobacterium parmae]